MVSIIYNASFSVYMSLSLECCYSKHSASSLILPCVVILSDLIMQKSYETKQYKKGLKAADAILKKFPDHGGELSTSKLSFYSFFI